MDNEAVSQSFGAYHGEEPYIFASYAHDDGEARKDIETLNLLGYRIWYDERIENADEWEVKITDAIRRCTLFVVFVSAPSVASKWVRLELRRASREKKPITPIFFQEERIQSDHLSLDELYDELQGINRWRHKKADDYFAELQAKLPRATRHDDVERDCRILGLGTLPEMREIKEGKLSLDDDQKTKNQAKLVLKLHQAAVPIYSMDTVFQLTSADTDAITKLGDHLIRPRNPSEVKPSNLLTHPLSIDSAYLAPLRLVTGLITRLDENWPPLVASYTELVRQKDRLEDFHYFVEYCWLAWGPSVPTTSLLDDPRAHFMVVQVAYGDEANSVPLIMKKEKWLELIATYREMHETSGRREKFEHRMRSGWPVRLDNLLVVKPQIDPFFSGLSGHELLRNMLQTEEDEPDAVVLYLPAGDEGYAAGSVAPSLDEAGACYSTAYVWLMIESANGKTDALTPGRVIPFFEHANLATSKGLTFLEHCLARKAVYHVLECEQDSDYRDEGVYRFATALFPERMVEILHAEIGRLDAPARKVVQKRLAIPSDPKAWRAPAEVVQFADDLGDEITRILKKPRDTSGNDGGTGNAGRV